MTPLMWLALPALIAAGILLVMHWRAPGEFGVAHRRERAVRRLGELYDPSKDPVIKRKQKGE